MEKMLLMTILFVIIALFFTNVVSASTSNELPELIYTKCAKYGITDGFKVEMERFLKKHPISDAQTDAFLIKIDEIVSIMETARVNNLSGLSATELKTVQDLAREAASLLDVKLVWNNVKAEAYYDGKLIDVLVFESRLPYTGENINIALIVSTVAVCVLTACVLARKKLAYA